MNTVTDAIMDENRRIRFFRVSSDLLIQLILTRRTTLEEAEDMIDRLRSLAGRLFPGKDHVFDLIYMPRFRRALVEARLYPDQPNLRPLNAECAPEEGR